MNANRWTKIEELFDAALAMEKADRDAFLARACSEDRELRSEVESLLAADERTTRFMQPPTPDAMAAISRADFARLEEGTILGPWRIQREIASGGMGTVYLACRADGQYEQAVALKLIRPEIGREEIVERFRQERQTLARLNHPSIARLLDGGTTPGGLPYLVMEYVEGKPIDEHCRTRALTIEARLRIFRTVCDAVHHAHQNLVVHRDLKPSNILVTSDGTPKLLDFGIAKVLEPFAPASPIGAAETRARILTPEYASPEQVRGEPVTTATDVYSLGLLLYEILTGLHPFRRETSLPYEVERAICEEEPAKPSSVVRRSGSEPAAEATRSQAALKGDLDCIVLMALRKEPEHRYESVSHLAEDLDRYLEAQPVHARRGGLSYRARKFVGRHRIVVAITMLLGLSLVAGVIGITWSASLARERLAQVLRLSDLTRLSEYLAEADALWPNHPDAVRAMDRWLQRTRDLWGRLDIHRRTLDELRSRGIPVDAPASEGLEARSVPRGGLHFPSTEDAWEHEQLVKLVEGLEALAAPVSGAIAKVEDRLAYSRSVRRRTIEEPAQAWAAAIASIRNEAECPLYGGLVIGPQLGLVPIGKDPTSGLWEFAHLQTGEIPRRNGDGHVVPSEASGIVLVLVPGGTCWVGSEKPRAGRAASPNVDPMAAPNEVPANEVTLDPFFISKFEMSQAQWMRVMKVNPSIYHPAYPALPTPHSLRHPVESVSWNDCAWLLPRLGLEIPTEAQWERAARAGTTTPWWTGEEPRSLDGAANVADIAAAKIKAPWMVGLPPPLFDDGHVDHAPVDSFRPNGFGLFGSCGNVSEWTRDSFCFYKVSARIGDGERTSEDARRAARGGSFIMSPESVRSAVRMVTTTDFRAPTIGIRPSRRLDR